ncbi:MAG: NAD(P)-binding domain-containing protein [Acidimicrobiia bacterium]|nr:NAD(P)-binding domain-containing protein [Acidimicrobiia bacterium]
MADVCVIGAGSSGLTSIKALLDQGLDVDCFELGSDLGGNWRQGNDNGRSAAYDSLRIDTSKERMAYRDLPMPDDWPPYLHHTQVLEYFERYAETFDLRRSITFRTRVTDVRPAPDGGWDVTTEPAGGGDAETRRHRAVLVANGHHWDPHLPSWPGSFDGRILHSREYRSPEAFSGRRVLVVGIGNSGTDIAVDLTGEAAHVSLSTRRGAHVIPRFILGRPTDQWATRFSSRLPLPLARALYRVLLNAARGRQRRYGVPEPPNRLLEEHPTMSQEFLPLVRDGAITVRPDIHTLEGDAVRFVDGSAAEFDAVVAATGYTISFPFLPWLEVRDNDIGLYRKVVHPDHPGLFFIGLIQPLGAIMPLAEAQARWVARLLRGAPLPSTAEMKRSIAADRAALEHRYVPSRRHTIQVDYFPYLDLMDAEVAAADRVLV